MKLFSGSWVARGAVVGFGLVCVAAAYAGLSMIFTRADPNDLSVIYPFDGSMFPPEIIPPTIVWEDENPHADRWRVTISAGDDDPVGTVVDSTSWTPDDESWARIKRASLESQAIVTVESVNRVLGLSQSLATKSVSFSTSGDSVGAPIFYRAVPLPFGFALRNVSMIEWRLGNISSHETPPTVLTNLPVCGNCHSFSGDGRWLGMDVDIGNDKGAYVLTSFDEETVISRDKLISWRSFDPVPTFGMLPRVSPSGRYVLAGVKDRTVFLQREDITFSQIFFPVMGILAYFDRLTGTISSLPGANDEEYVQSNAVWSPDEEHVIFARSRAVQLQTRNDNKDILLSLEEAAEVLGGWEFLERAQEGGNKFLFDLYRVPFNDGRGGTPVPIDGASDNGMSNFFPKVSPDGKWMVFTRSHSFMLLQADSKLHIMPAAGGEPRLMNANTDRMNSWHSWSPNSKWVVFASKIFSPYTQLFLTHIDEDGNDTPPVLLRNFTSDDRAANIPEFVNIDPSSTRSIREMFVDDYNYFRSGRIYEQFQEFDRAEEQFLKSLETNPENTSALYSLGSMYADRDDFEEAEQLFERLVRLEPDNARVRNQLGRLHFTTERYDEARVEFEAAVRLDPGNVEALFNLGTIDLINGNLGGAESRFRSLLSLDIDDSTAVRVHTNLGQAFALQDDYRRTVQEFSVAVSLDSTNMNARYNLGIAQRALGNLGRARAQFETVVESNPTHFDARRELGFVLAELGEFQSAVRELEAVIAQTPSDPTALAYLGRVYLETQRYPDAERALATLVDIEPNNVAAHVDLGRVYGEMREYSQAVAAFRSALQSDPNNPLVHFMLAEALGREGTSLEESMEAYRTGLRMDPRNTEAFISLGEVCLRAGDPQGAINAFQAALDLNPPDADRQYLEAQLADLRSRDSRP